MKAPRRHSRRRPLPARLSGTALAAPSRTIYGRTLNRSMPGIASCRCTSLIITQQCIFPVSMALADRAPLRSATRMPRSATRNGRDRRIDTETSDFSHQRSFHFAEATLFSHLLSSHVHANAEIGLITEGRGRMYLNGVYHPIRAGDIYVVDCMFAHGHEPDRGTRIHNRYVHVKYDALLGLAPPDEHAWFMRLLLQCRDPAFCPVFRGVPDVARLLEHGYALFASGERRDYLIAWARLIEAATLLAERLPAPSHSPAQYAAVSKAQRYIADHFLDDITIAQIAYHVCLSPSRLAHVFSDALHISPIAYRNKLRINRALELFQTGVGAVEATARACGFASRAQFRRLFREHTGMNPRDFVQQNRIHSRQHG
ncbi:MAG: helix-turn-helix domain-containing protein [Chitinivibrionales bacterium]|nr:helix-turn-helix domain-containing protein [Chitinivibrionales bacterium]